jgi:hypothetical protein
MGPHCVWGGTAAKMERVAEYDSGLKAVLYYLHDAEDARRGRRAEADGWARATTAAALRTLRRLQEDPYVHRPTPQPPACIVISTTARGTKAVGRTGDFQSAPYSSLTCVCVCVCVCACVCVCVCVYMYLAYRRGAWTGALPLPSDGDDARTIAGMAYVPSDTRVFWRLDPTEDGQRRRRRLKRNYRGSTHPEATIHPDAVGAHTLPALSCLGARECMGQGAWLCVWAHASMCLCVYVLVCCVCLCIAAVLSATDHPGSIFSL